MRNCLYHLFLSLLRLRLQSLSKFNISQDLYRTGKRRVTLGSSQPLMTACFICTHMSLKDLTISISFFCSTISLLSMTGGLFRPKLCGIVVKNFEESACKRALSLLWFMAASISSSTSKPFAICCLLSLPKGIFLMSV